jgi:hypothetical protein
MGFFKPPTREAPSTLFLKVRETQRPGIPKENNPSAQVKHKKSLVSMLKKIDGKLLDVLRKNSGLLKKDEQKTLRVENILDDEACMIPKGLSSRRLKKANKSSECKSSRRKTPLTNRDSLKTTSYIQLDLSKNTLKNQQGIYLAQPNYRSTFVCTLADGTVPAIQKNFGKPRGSLSNSLRSLKRIGKVDSLKKLSVDQIYQPPLKADQPRHAASRCHR